MNYRETNVRCNFCDIPILAIEKNGIEAAKKTVHHYDE